MKRPLASFRAQLAVLLSALILFAVSVPGVVSAGFFIGRMNEEITRYNQAQTEAIARHIHQQVFGLIPQAAIDLTSAGRQNQDLTAFLSGGASDHIWRSAQVASRLSSASALISGVLDAQLYARDAGVVVSGDGRIRILGVAYALSPPMDTHWIDVFDEMEGVSQDGWLPPRIVRQYDSSGVRLVDYHVLTYIRCTPYYTDKRNYHGLIALTVKMDAIRRTVDEIRGGRESRLEIVDRSGRVFYHDDVAMLGQSIAGDNFFAELLRRESGPHASVIMNGNAYSAYFGEGGWVFISSMPTERFYRETSRMRQLLLLASAVALTVFIITGMLALGRVTKPLSENMASLSGQVRTLSELQEKQRPILENAFYLSWLEGQNTDPAERQERLAALARQLSGARCALAVIELPKENPPLGDNRLAELTNRILISMKNAVPVTRGRQTLYLIMGYGSSEGREGQALALGDIIDGFSARAGLGDEVSSVEVLPATLPAALYALCYQEMYPRIPVFDAQKVAKRGRAMDESTIADVQRAVATLDQLAVSSSLGRARAALLGGEISFEAYRAGREKLHARVRDIIEAQDAHAPELSRLAELFELRPADKYLDALEETLLGFVCRMLKRAVLAPTDHVSEASEYIRKHLSQDISLELVAEHLDLSASYLSRIFKEKTGINFVDFVAAVRVEEGKRLLEQTGLTVAAVAQLVGVRSASHFIRMFKESQGLTPLQYRRLRKKRGE